MRTNAMRMLFAGMLGGLLATGAWAGESSTSATAGANGRGSGTAAATADYQGNGIGFTKTKARTGRLNFARGLSVGFDETGLSLSHSYALAGQRGPAVGGTLNLHVGLDGQTSVSGGRVTADGSPERSVTTGGVAGNTGRTPYAASSASGRTAGRGDVQAKTFSRTRAHERTRESAARRTVYRRSSRR